jgi:2-polyprenyl-3-methyl-5-hydroxy-6-metoxy-1,4-benzoquinol methylase
MKIIIDDKDLTIFEQNEILSLLKRQMEGLDDLAQMWHLMDLVWDDFQCDNKNFELEKIEKFYSHPVWLLNGLFIEQHSDSMSHRHAMSDWVTRKKFKNIVDYGGGFGTLSRLIAKKNNVLDVNIYEPHPSEFGLKRAAEFDNINIVSKLGSDYDCLVCMSVLEHVPNPLEVFFEMIQSVKTGGYLIIENCFSPVIKCHLPQTFHLKYTFKYFAKMMGLELISDLEGSYSTIFRKKYNKELKISRFILYQGLSKIIFILIESLKSALRPLKRFLFR